jgi:hypothetical protein
LRALFEKIGTGITKLLLERVPVAADLMLVPLGSPTVTPVAGDIPFR